MRQARIMIYSHQGNIILKSRDADMPETGQEIGIVNNEGVSSWLTTQVTTEHIDELDGLLCKAELQPI